MSKIFVTGGAGFLGSYVVDQLVAEGHEVHIVDHFQKEKRCYINEAARVHKLDFADEKMHELLLAERPDAVIHLAAQISVTHSIAHPVDDAEQNIIKSVRFAKWCQETGVQRFVFASSGGAIYGDHPEHPTSLLIDASPLCPYGLAKQAVERYLGYLHETFGMGYVAVRFANLYGPRQQANSGEGNVICVYLSRMLGSGEPFVIFGEGDATRDYLHARDAANVLCKAVTSSFSGVVNAGTATEVSVRQLADELMRLHGTDYPVIYKPFRSGEVFRSSIDYSSAKAALHWEPQISFADGLAETYAWYKKEFGS